MAMQSSIRIGNTTPSLLQEKMITALLTILYKRVLLQTYADDVDITGLDSSVLSFAFFRPVQTKCHLSLNKQSEHSRLLSFVIIDSYNLKLVDDFGNIELQYTLITVSAWICKTHFCQQVQLCTE